MLIQFIMMKLTPLEKSGDYVPTKKKKKKSSKDLSGCVITNIGLDLFPCARFLYLQQQKVLFRVNSVTLVIGKLKLFRDSYD